MSGAEPLEAYIRRLTGGLDPTTRGLIDNEVQRLQANVERKTEALRNLSTWADRMPDAMLKAGDPRYDWWFEGVDERRAARAALEADA